MIHDSNLINLQVKTCEHLPCMNGGTCNPGGRPLSDDLYTCDCTTGFKVSHYNVVKIFQTYMETLLFTGRGLRGEEGLLRGVRAAVPERRRLRVGRHPLLLHLPLPARLRGREVCDQL